MTTTSLAYPLALWGLNMLRCWWDEDGVKRRTWGQREWVKRWRRGWTGGEEQVVTDEAWAETEAVLVTTVMGHAVLAFVAMYGFVEGSALMSVNMLGTAIGALIPLWWTMGMSWDVRMRTALWASRLAQVFQFVSIWLRDSVTPPYFRRALLIRTLMALGSLEGIEDIVFQLFSVAYAFSFKCAPPDRWAPYALAAQLMLIVVCPIIFTGARGLITSRLREWMAVYWVKSRTTEVWIMMTICWVPTLFMFVQFRGGGTEHALPPISSSLLQGIMAVGFISIAFSVKMIPWLGDFNIRSDRRDSDWVRSGPVSFAWLATLAALFVHWDRTFVVPASKFRYAFPASLAANIVISGIVSRILTRSLDPSVPSMLRGLLLFGHGTITFCMIIFGPKEPVPTDDDVIVLLAVIRLSLAMEQRVTLVGFLQEHMILAGLTCAAVSSIEALVIVSVTNLCVAMAGMNTAASVYSIDKVLEMHADAQSFVEHALKQKLGGCAIALASALQDPAMSRDSHSDLTRLIKIALQNARAGHDKAILAAMKRRFARTGKCGGQSVARKLSDVVIDLRNLFGDRVSELRADAPQPREETLRANWDVARLVLGVLVGAGSPKIIRVSLHPRPGSSATPVLMWEIAREDHGMMWRPNNAKSLLESCEVLVKDLGADVDLSGQGAGVVFRMPVTREGWNDFEIDFEGGGEDTSTGGGSVATTTTIVSAPFSINDASLRSPQVSPEFVHLRRSLGSVDEESFPPNLTVAILDDLVLLRITTLRFFVREFKCDATRSFATGATPQEAMDFPRRVVEDPPDLIILDQRLDYHDQDDKQEELLGTNIAAQIRAAGLWSACIVLYSAHEFSSDGLLDDAIVDGVWEKQILDKSRMAPLLAAAMRKARARLQHAGKR